MILPDAVGRWHAGCTIREGDRVVITSPPPMLSGPKHGWWCYRECLVAGATATAVERPKFVRGSYQALIRLDRQWSVHDAGTPYERRFFAGDEHVAFGLFLYPVDWLAPFVPRPTPTEGNQA